MFTVLVIAVVVFFIIRAIVKSSSNYSKTQQFDLVMSGQAPKGKVGRALILSAARVATPTKLFGRVVEQRNVRIEVEVPGSDPYELNLMLIIPLGLVEARPGDMLEVAVDPRNPSNITVLGPGGFTGPWLRPLGYSGNVNLGY